MSVTRIKVAVIASIGEDAATEERESKSDRSGPRIILRVDYAVRRSEAM